MKYIDADLLRERIGKNQYVIEPMFLKGDDSYYEGEYDGYNRILSIIGSLQQEMWKPSEEQMEVLKDYADSAIDSQRDIEGNILFSLYDDLEKLTESNFDPKVPSIKEAVIKIVKSISPKVLEYEGFSREQVVKWLYDKEE